MRARPVAIVGRFVAIAWAATAWAATASAQPVDHEAAAYQLAADGKLDEALAEFALAYEAAPVPQLLFAMGRVHVMRGDCVRASDHFERFLATRPGPKAVDAARAEIARCEPAPVIVEPPPDPVPGPVTIEPAPMPRPQRASFASALVHDRFAQLGAVSGVVAGGLLLYGLHLSCWDGVCEGSYADYQDKRDRAPTVGYLAAGFGVAAGALVTAGVVRTLLRSDDAESFGVAAVPLAGGGSLTVAGRF